MPLSLDRDREAPHTCLGAKVISDEEILDRALPVIAAGGPAGFTLADVARKVGVAPATLLQRFGDKQTLIERAFARDNERFVAWLESLPEGVGADVVIRIYSDATKLFGDNPSLADHLLWLREDIRDPALNRLSQQRFKLFRADDREAPAAVADASAPGRPPARRTVSWSGDPVGARAHAAGSPTS